MTATYWALISDELMEAGLTWPDGMRVTGPPMPDQHWNPFMHWYQVTDDNAAPELDGKRVELSFRLEGRVPVVAGREVLP